MFFVYILYSQSYKRYYIGMSKEVKIRLNSHNNKEVKSTKPYVPWQVVHTEEFSTRQLARDREKYLKSAAGRRWRKNNLGM